MNSAHRAMLPLLLAAVMSCHDGTAAEQDQGVGSVVANGQEEEELDASSATAACHPLWQSTTEGGERYRSGLLACQVEPGTGGGDLIVDDLVDACGSGLGPIPDGDAGVLCTEDSECPAGYCAFRVTGYPPVQDRVCAEEPECMDHSDCEDGYGCFCASSTTTPGFGLGYNPRNRCLPMGCKSSDECDEHACAVSILDEHVGFEGSYCHTDQDDCLSNTDCESALCSYDVDAGKWMCIGRVGSMR